MYLMTHSLLSSWQYFCREHYSEEAEEKAYADFLRTLNREKGETNEAMQNGIDFERLIEKACNGLAIPEGHKWASLVNEAADFVRGGVWQTKASRPKRINGIDFLLYGRFDVLKAGIIYDIKFISSSAGYDTGKYFDSTQHPMYLEIEQSADEFRYLVGDKNGIYLEKYTRSDTPSIDGDIEKFMDFLRMSGLEQTYFEKWRARG